MNALWLGQRMLLHRVCFILLSLASWHYAHSAPAPEQTERIAIISAFAPELTLLIDQVQDPVQYDINGVTFTTGSLQDHSVVLFLSGMSMTNAAMTTQLALNRFNISRVIFSGVAGGVNPDLHIGDVTVVEQWGHYLEVWMARETGNGQFSTFGVDEEFVEPGFGMMITRPIEVRSSHYTGLENRFWFPVDPDMLSVAKTLDHVQLQSCDEQNRCLHRQPRLVVGGNGVSGSAFVDNAALREHLFSTFNANVVDMESAACAMVAYSNGVPFIAFRSLSDLAGADEGANQMLTFLDIAASNSATVLLAFLEAWP